MCVTEGKLRRKGRAAAGWMGAAISSVWRRLNTAAHSLSPHTLRHQAVLCYDFCSPSGMVVSKSLLPDGLVGLVIKASTLRAEDPGFECQLRWDFFSGSSHTSDFKTDTPVATLPVAWRYRVSAGTGWPGVSILWLGEVESLIYNFYLSVAAHPWDRYTGMLLGR